MARAAAFQARHRARRSLCCCPSRGHPATAVGTAPRPSWNPPRSLHTHRLADPPLPHPGLVPDLKAVAADVVALLERSRARYGSVPLFLFGSSMGGLSAALASLSLPERSILSGAVLVCPLIRPARQPPAAVRLFAAALTFAGGGSLALVPRAAGASSPAARAAALADGRVYTGWLRVGTGVALLRGARDLASRLDGFDVPFLLQHGADDADVALAGSAELMARSPNAASHKRLLTYAGAGHNLLHERPPVLAAVRRDYLAWLDERVAAVAAGRAASEASAQL